MQNTAVEGDKLFLAMVFTLNLILGAAKDVEMKVLGLEDVPHPSPAEAIEDLVLAIEHRTGPESERLWHCGLRITELRLRGPLYGAVLLPQRARQLQEHRSPHVHHRPV